MATKHNNIDLNKWVSQAYLAEKFGLNSTQIVSNWIARGRIDALYVEQLRMNLVANISSISQLRKAVKKV